MTNKQPKGAERETCEDWEKLRAGYEEVQMVESSIENAYPEAYRLARKFHELYEQQAPFFGYITNPNSREFYPNSNNARLMAYVCYKIIEEEKQAEREKAKEEVRQEEREKVVAQFKEITKTKFPLGERKWCIECADRLLAILTTLTK